MFAKSSLNYAWCVPHIYRCDDGLRIPLKITAWVDDGLDDHSYIVPGLGDFGDR
jgi:hypothetical protein